jgi:hypothetical protein
MIGLQLTIRTFSGAFFFFFPLTLTRMPDVPLTAFSKDVETFVESLACSHESLVRRNASGLS